MTEDKEIIIDGVDVAGCYWKCKDGDCAMYYADLSADNNELEFGFNCEDNPDCYFKELKRLEQENNSLQAQLNNITVQSNNAITALEQENKALQAYKDINEDFKKAWDELNEKYKQLRSALGEIRKDINNLPNEPLWQSMAECLDKIQNKINEVLK